jgi:hypothetical protein
LGSTLKERRVASAIVVAVVFPLVIAGYVVLMLRAGARAKVNISANVALVASLMSESLAIMATTVAAFQTALILDALAAVIIVTLLVATSIIVVAWQRKWSDRVLLTGFWLFWIGTNMPGSGHDIATSTPLLLTLKRSLDVIGVAAVVPFMVGVIYLLATKRIGKVMLGNGTAAEQDNIPNLSATEPTPTERN